MLFLYLLLFKVTTTLGNECHNLLELNEGEVKELVNPKYPLSDDPGENCTWTVVAESHRRIVLVCPFNDGSDTRTDKRNECGAEMSVKDVGGKPTLYCRDKTFTRLGNSNRMFVNYKNDDGKFYNRTSGFKCYSYAPLKSLSEPYSQQHKEADETAPFGTCDYFIRMSEYDFVRLDAPKYTEEQPSWRRCRWTAAVTKGRQLAITCPFTNRSPNPILTQVELCNGEFLVRTLQSSTKYYCNDKAFSQTSEKHTIVLEYMSLMRLPSEDFECYLHSKSPSDESSESITEPSPYENCDHFLELNGTVVFKSPSFPEKVNAGKICRWTAITPESTEISLSCLSQTKYVNGTQGNPCHGQFNVTMPGGKTSTHCQDKGFTFFSNSRYNWMTITYANPSSEPVDAFECTISYGPDAECKNCTEIVEPENKKCDNLIKLKKREVSQILSPNHPHNESAGSTCSWTVVADTDRRIVLVCPFSHSLEKTYTREDPQPCNGQFSVLPVGGKETNHCLDRGFSRIGPSNRMVITFKNPTNEALDSFSCYVYAELKSLWDNNTETQELDYNGFDYKITLDGYNTTTLVPPSEPEDEKGWSKARWNISAPHGSRITIACHFTNKPPEPLTIQVVPCRGRFKILAEGAEKTYDCADRAFSYSTKNGWAVLSYENPQRKRADNFVCFAYANDDSTSVDVASRASAMENCDNLIQVQRREIRRFVSPHHVVEGDEGRVACRWRFLGPPKTRIVFACLAHFNRRTMDSQALPCRSQFTVLLDGRNNSFHCSDRTFSETSDNNWLDLIYENEFRPYFEAFQCQLYVEDDEVKPPPLPFGEVSPREINLTSNARASIQSPSHPDNEKSGWIIHWSVNAPPDSRIILSCTLVNKPPWMQLFNEDKPCTAFITVTTENGPNTTYCHDSAFVRTSVSNKMLVTYDNPSEIPTQSFKCYLYSEPKSFWSACENCNVAKALPYEKCDQFYNLTFEQMTELKMPSDDKPGTFCRWTVVSPPNSQILVSCPFNYVMPVTENLCSSYYTVSSAGKEARYCRSDIFHQISTANWTILTYDNPSAYAFTRFVCYAYVERKLPPNECVNCTEHNALDYNRCNITQYLYDEKQITLQTGNYPENVVPGMPCRWTVIAPVLSTISMTCDPDDKTVNKDDSCRGMIAVYGAGQEPEYRCRHLSFGLASTAHKLVVTYGNQVGLTEKGFKCYVRSVDSNCRSSIHLGRLKYNEYFNLSTPYWNSSVHSPPPCYWSIESPSDTRLYLVCNKYKAKPNEKVVFSTTGDEELKTNVTVRSLTRGFTAISEGTKMTVLYNATVTKNSGSIGCRMYVDSVNPVPVECNCGNKFNKLKPPADPVLTNIPGDAVGAEVHPDAFPMIAAIVASRKEYHRLFCGATIISDRHALTTASCMDKLKVLKILEQPISVLVGAHQQKEDGRDNLYKVESYKVHHGYDKRLNGHKDLAVVTVKEPIIFNDLIGPVCLPYTDLNRNFTEESIVFLGWKEKLSVLEDETLNVLNSNYLMKMNGYVDTFENCRASFGRFSDTTVCVVYTHFPACPGELGGPIYWKDPETGLWKLIGIDIGRKACSDKAFSAKLVPIAQNLDWIEEVLPNAKFCKVE